MRGATKWPKSLQRPLKISKGKRGYRYKSVAVSQYSDTTCGNTLLILSKNKKIYAKYQICSFYM